MVVDPAFPIAIFGLTALVAAAVALMLPETLYRGESHNLRKKNRIAKL